jgi:hypothetical protein
MVYKEYSTRASTKINVRKTNLVELVKGRKAFGMADLLPAKQARLAILC